MYCQEICNSVWQQQSYCLFKSIEEWFVAFQWWLLWWANFPILHYLHVKKLSFQPVFKQYIRWAPKRLGGGRLLKNSKKLAKMNGNYSRGHCSTPHRSTVVHSHLLLQGLGPFATVLEIAARKSKLL